MKLSAKRSRGPLSQVKGDSSSAHQQSKNSSSCTLRPFSRNCCGNRGLAALPKHQSDHNETVAVVRQLSVAPGRETHRTTSQCWLSANTVPRTVGFIHVCFESARVWSYSVIVDGAQWDANSLRTKQVFVERESSAGYRAEPLDLYELSMSILYIFS